MIRENSWKIIQSGVLKVCCSLDRILIASALAHFSRGQHVHVVDLKYRESVNAKSQVSSEVLLSFPFGFEATIFTFLIMKSGSSD